MMRLVIKAVKELDDLHFKILRAIESNMETHEVVPIEKLSKDLRLPTGLLSEMLSNLHSLHLIWAPLGRDKGYVLNYNGLDALALRSLSRRGIIESIGRNIGVGKEAEIYEALTGEGREVALKFYRIGKQSTKKYKRYRDVKLWSNSALTSSKATAKRELEALQMLSRRKLDVPTPIYRNRHVLVTSLVEGIELSKVKRLKDPYAVLKRILWNIEEAFKAGVIHCDLSAYNVLYYSNEEEKISIIDWPQWVTPSHSMAEHYLRRDVMNVVNFFRRRLHFEVSREEIQEIIGHIVVT